MPLCFPIPSLSAPVLFLFTLPLFLPYFPSLICPECSVPLCPSVKVDMAVKGR